MYIFSGCSSFDGTSVTIRYVFDWTLCDGTLLDESFFILNFMMVHIFCTFLDGAYGTFILRWDICSVKEGHFLTVHYSMFIILCAGTVRYMLLYTIFCEGTLCDYTYSVMGKICMIFPCTRFCEWHLFMVMVNCRWILCTAQGAHTRLDSCSQPAAL